MKHAHSGRCRPLIRIHVVNRAPLYAPCACVQYVCTSYHHPHMALSAFVYNMSHVACHSIPAPIPPAPTSIVSVAPPIVQRGRVEVRRACPVALCLFFFFYILMYAIYLLSRFRRNAESNLGGTQAFLSLVLPDLEQSGPRVRDPAKEKEVRVAAEKAIKEIRSYGLEVTTVSWAVLHASISVPLEGLG